MNYIGSKYSLLHFLQTTIDEICGLLPSQHYVFADLFSGTGVVAAAYKKLGCNVIANDIQYYSYVLNKHYIENSLPMNQNLVLELNKMQGIDGFVYENYCAGSGSGRNYFTDQNGQKCDAIRIQIEELLANGTIDKPTYFYYLASLLNSIDRYANTASVYGAFLKHIKKSAQKDFVMNLLPIVQGVPGQVFNEDANKLIRHIQGDVLYLDPPYNARQYCSNYHVLETIARYDNPILKGITGQRDTSMQKSAFCSKKTVVQAFEDLIVNAKFKYVFLSYNNEGLMPLETIKDIMSKYGKYGYRTLKYKRFKADSDARRKIYTNSTIEYLHYLMK